MAPEALKNSSVRLADRDVILVCPISYMFCRPNVSTGRNLCLSTLKQVIGEAFNQRAGRTIANRLDPLG